MITTPFLIGVAVGWLSGLLFAVLEDWWRGRRVRHWIDRLDDRRL